MEFLIQIVIIALSPWVLNKYLAGRKISTILSPVVMAYLIGIIIATFNLIPLNEQVNKYASEVSIMVAIPLLLFNADIMGFLKQSKKAILSFIIAVSAAVFSSSLSAFFYKNDIDNAWQQAGMLIGVLTGGTANMQAVSVAIKGEDLFVILNASEIFWGGILLLILTSFAHTALGKFLPQYVYKDEEHGNFDDVALTNYKQMFIGIGISILIVVMVMTTVYFFFGGLDNSNMIIILLTSLGVTASFSENIRKLESSFIAAEYLLLVFCVSAGMRTDFVELVNTGGNVVLFAGFAMGLMVVLFLIFSRIAKIDRDTTIMMITATIYGPAFIGQIAKVINNKEIIILGMACGIMGYVVGNYLGIGMSYLLESYLNTG